MSDRIRSGSLPSLVLNLFRRGVIEAHDLGTHRFAQRTINRWAIRFLPVIEKLSRSHKRPVGASWRMDETYIKVKGAWKYPYRAVDKEGKTVDFLLTTGRDITAAR